MGYFILFLFVFSLLIPGEIHRAQAAGISISSSSFTLSVNHYKTLYVYGTSKTVTWTSSNKAIATVSSGGRVTAKTPGTVTIYASVSGKKLSCKVTVIKLNTTSATLAAGNTKTLKIYGTSSTVTWSSGNKSVAAVTSSGKVTAKAPGSATIYAQVLGKKLSCKVTVIKLNTSSVTLAKGAKKTLKVYGTSAEVTWSSGNKTVAVVNSSGTVTAKAPGTATIYAAVAGGKLTCKITVGSPSETQNQSLDPARKIVGYYAAWSSYAGYTPDKIDVSKLTHINYAFANIGSDLRIALGYPDVDPANISRLNQLKNSNPNLKTILSVGGWTWSGRFSDVSLTQESRANFADSCVEFLVRYGFDGIDIDWEYPVSGGISTNIRRPEDKYNFTLLLQTLREKLDARGAVDGKKYLLTFAGAAGTWYTNNTELSKISQYVDYANIMSYDIHGTWEPYTNFNAPLYNSDPLQSYSISVDSSIQNWLRAGFPKDKLVMGVPFYGFIYKAVGSANNGLFQTYSGAASISYANIASNYLNNSSYIRYYNSTAKVPWLFDGSTFLSYEDEQSISEKARYVKDSGLSGVMIWELSQDPNKILLSSLYQTLNQ